MGRRRLDAELVRRKLVASRAAAQTAIVEGGVEVEGIVATKAATQVDETASIRIATEALPFVSRGGLKLAAALDVFEISVTGRRALDAGASTGGFTDCLLQRGAASVAAVDVGYGQLDWKLRQDARVAVFERLNVRHMDIAEIGGPFDVVVADLAFISLRTVADQLVAAGAAQADWVLLLKPQFEAGRDEVGRGGIVRDAAVRASTIHDVTSHYAARGVGAKGVIDSPITGAKGNREFLIWLQRGEATVTADDVTALEGARNA